jgi:hypothetical protein
MTDMNRRLEKLEARSALRLVSGMSPKLRRVLTDRAVFYGDQDALHDLAAYRSTGVAGTREQRDAARAAALRADI